MNKYVTPACFIGWLVVLMIRPVFTYAADESVPPLVNYQGSLTDANGAPMAGVKSMEFNLYDAPTGGNLIWGPQIYATVPLIGGKFNVLLGATDGAGRPITGAFADKTRYLSITLEGKEILPRQQILSTPFAMQAQEATHSLHSNTAENGAPKGMVAPFDLSACPSGWLPADGLHGRPDLRGEFVRGLDNGRGIDQNRTLGSFQLDQMQVHTHRVAEGVIWSRHVYGASSDTGILAPVLGPGAAFDNYPETTGARNARHGSETRPRNIALLFCVKD